jgi:hypothetical protein
VLEEIITCPKRSSSRVTAGLGISYSFLEALIIAGLVQTYKKKT